MSALVNLEDWISSEGLRPGESRFRQAVSIILNAIESSSALSNLMVIKGGVLMALRYHSIRYTRDMDFSTEMSLDNLNKDEFEKTFRKALTLASADSPYDLECRIQSFTHEPKNQDQASFPSIQIKIGYAGRGKPEHKGLLRGRATNVIKIDFSLNEIIVTEEVIEISGGKTIRAYAFSDMVAEKLRSLLQQPLRKRYRRQDVYDLCLLIDKNCSDDEKNAILTALVSKSKSRGLNPDQDSMSHPEIRRRASEDYHTLSDEVGGVLPDFDTSFDTVESFYKSLPWPG